VTDDIAKLPPVPAPKPQANPGPWRWERNWLVDAQGIEVSRYIEANARLIAGAPEMAALLREELTFEPDSEMGFQPELPGSYRARVRALLKRIDGET